MRALRREACEGGEYGLGGSEYSLLNRVNFARRSTCERDEGEENISEGSVGVIGEGRKEWIM